MEIDRKTLKALGAETRMDILKSLSNRRKTPSELSRELKLSPPTILEHLSKQGDYKFFFSEFSEYWRILKLDGRFHASVPRWDRKWAWGDPGHTRVFPVELVTYLDQDEYEEQIGITQMTDYRNIYKVSFKLVYYERCEVQDLFVLKKM